MSYSLNRQELIQRGEQVLPLVLPSVGSIYGIYHDANRPAQFLGTGTFIKHRKDIFLLTAMHVVENSSSYKHIFHDRGGNGEKMVPFRSGWTG